MTAILFRTPCSLFAAVWVRNPVKEADVSPVPTSLLASRRHLVLSAHRACRSLREGSSISKHFRYEMLACVTGVREISKLMKLRGDAYVLVRMCSELEECLSWLVRVTAKQEPVTEIYEGVFEGATCTGSEELVAMEAGALLELER